MASSKKTKFKVGQAVLFNDSSNFFSKIITKYNLSNYGKSKCVHAGIIARVHPDKILIYEAKSFIDGFEGYYYEIKELEEKIKEGSVIIKESKVKLNDVLGNCERYVGIKYGFLDILMIGFYWLTRFKISLTGRNRLICSEAVVRVLYDSSNKKIDFEKEFNKPYDLITPMDIYKSKQLEDIE